MVCSSCNLLMLSFILVLKSNAPKGPKRGPWRRSFSEFSCEHSAWRIFMKHLPHVEKTPSEIGDPCVCLPYLSPKSGTQGRHGHDRGLPVGVCPFPESGCGPRPQMSRLPLAASQVLCLPHSAFPMVHRISNRLNRCNTFLSGTVLVSELHLCYHSVEQRDPIFNRRRLAPWTQKKLLCAG